MSIKYVEVTVIRNIEEEDVFRSISRYFGFENVTNNTDTIIITFDDGTICDTKHEYEDKQYKFTLYLEDRGFPLKIEKTQNEIFLYKNPELNTLEFKDIFANSDKYNKEQKVPSVYNVIYTNLKLSMKEQFAIVKIKSNEIYPRYLLAYDDSVFDRSDIIYLANCFFQKKFQSVA